MPQCIECHAEYDARRKALGYKTCLDCGEATARAVKFCIAPVTKSNYVVISDKRDLKGLNKYANS
jgi:ribosomal protein L37AE/L43A